MIWKDALGQAEEIRSGGVSALELVDDYLERIERIDPALRSYVAVATDVARGEARSVDERIARAVPGETLPPFLGVPLSVKDVIDVAGLATTHSCKVLADNVAEHDAPLVRRFREAGFILLGKTNVPEFCTSMTDSELHGTCRNPWNFDHTPGGSSGGAAAALTAGLCALAHGTDGAGSVRVPASFCGLVGLKPSRGRVGFGPDEDPAYFGTSVDGVLTRSVRDAAAVLDVMSEGSWSPSPSTPFRKTAGREPGRLRIALSVDAPFGAVDPECAAAVPQVGRVLESLGNQVCEATPPWSTILAVADGPMSVPGMAGLVGPGDIDRLEPRNRRIWAGLDKLSIVEHARWVERTRAASRQFCEFWNDHDVLVTPTAGIPAPSLDYARWNQSPEEHLETFAAFPNFAYPFNLSGQPALSLPLAWHSSGLPIGIQLAARPFAEETLLQVATLLEAACPWRGRRPSAF